MNRRQLLTTTLPALGLLLANSRSALARMQYLATSEAEETAQLPIELDKYSQVESIYLGILFTWLELLEDTIDDLYVGIDALEVDPESTEAKIQVLLPMGVWRHLSVDTERFEGPESFGIVHHYARSAFSHLGSAAEIISTGVMSESPTAVTVGAEHVFLASDEIGKLVSALPFDRPSRSDLIN